MVLVEQETANISFDMEGDPYFMVGETTYYLSEFIKIKQVRGVKGDGVTHITNTGSMIINIDEANEQVEYSIFTN